MTVTEKEVIQYVTEAGDEWQYHDDDDKQFLVRFAAIIEAKTREKDARICEARVMGDNNREDAEAKRCANAIRGQE